MRTQERQIAAAKDEATRRRVGRYRHRDGGGEGKKTKGQQTKKGETNSVLLLSSWLSPLDFHVSTHGRKKRT